MTTYKTPQQEAAAAEIRALMKRVEALIKEATELADNHALGFGFPLDGADISYEPRQTTTYGDGETEESPGGFTGWISSQLGC